MTTPQTYGNGAVPDGWRWVRLGDVCRKPEYGAAAPALPYQPDLPRYVRISDITDDGRLRAEQARSADPAQINGYELGEGDFLFARSGSVGRTYRFRSTDGPCVFAGYLIRFRPQPNQLDVSYLDHWTHSGTYYRWVESIARRGAQTNINAAEYSSLPILLPPLAEQRAIASVLDSIDEAIERTEAVIAATETLRDSLLHELLTRGVPGWHTEWKDVPGIGTIPADWEVEQLRDILVLDQPGAWGADPTTENASVPVLRAADLTRDGHVNPKTAARRVLSERDLSRRLMEDGDIILERSGGGPGTPVGRVALIWGFGTIYCNNFCQQLRVDKNRCHPAYAVRNLWHRYLRGVTARLEHQTTGIRNLDYDGYLSHPIALPSFAEQRAVINMLDSVDERLLQMSAELETIKQAKSALADALLSGRGRASVAHFEVGSARGTDSGGPSVTLGRKA